MEKLGFGSLYDIVIKQMKKDQKAYEREQKQKNSKKEKVSSQDNNNIQESETPKKQTSINQTIREINKYFDLDTLELKEALSLDQIIYILSLMYLGNVEDDKVETFLRKSAREFKQFHPYAIYHQGYDKFSYLGGDNPEIKEHLDMIEYILSDASIFICDDEAYKSIKELAEEELKEIMFIINGNYTFEIEEAKQLLKNNNN